jgi:hypothetical protein
MTKRKTIAVPCIVTTWLYADFVRKPASACDSWIRMRIAIRPAMKKKTNAVTR